MSNSDLLEQRLHALEARLQRLEATAAIERLQRMYGYYLDNRMWKEVVALFTDDGEAEIGRRGIYRGREQLRTFFFDVLGSGRTGRARNELHNHIQIQGIVTIEDDGQQGEQRTQPTQPTKAHGRFRALAQFAAQLPDGAAGCGWAEGVYENEYAYRDGAWRIHVLRWTASFYGRLPPEAIAAGAPSAPASTKFPPSAPPTYDKSSTGSFILPFHYKHPHTGEPTPIE
jgi:hypothetical protein